MTNVLLLLLVIASRAAIAADNCYPPFRDPVDKTIRYLSQDCKAIEADEPGNCQRAVGERCQKSYNEVRRIRADVCSGLAGDADFIKSRQYSEGVDSQKSGQDANVSLGSDTASISDGMASTLNNEAGKLTALIKENDAVIKAEYCTRAAIYHKLANRTKILSDHLVSTRGVLEALAKKKKSDSAQATTVASISEQRSQSLTSVNPVITGDTFDSDGNRVKKWIVPALAAGGAAAILYAVLKKKDKGAPTPPVDLSPGDDSEPGPGGAPATPPGPQPPPFSGDPGKFFDASGVRVDPAFSDAAKRQIANAVNYFPDCQRKFLAGATIRSNPRLVWQSSAMAGKCLPGKNVSMNPPTIELNETCQTGMGTHSALVVHELMHVLANRRGLYARYRAAFNANPGCGVSRYSHVFYGGRNINEDFAEAARFVVFPASGQVYGGPCVNNRIQAVREIINSCK